MLLPFFPSIWLLTEIANGFPYTGNVLANNVDVEWIHISYVFIRQVIILF